MTHEELQSALPAYVASRLSGEDLERMKDHLDECADCRSVAATLGVLAAAVREGGDDLFEPHPDPLELRSLALGLTNGADHEPLRRHVTRCASCGLETQAWQRQEAAAGEAATAPEVKERPARVWRSVLWAAAGLVLGIALTLLSGLPVAMRSTSSGDASWAGPTAQIVLPAVVRGEAPSVSRHAIGQGERRVVVSFPAVDGDFPGETYRFAITGEAGEAFSRIVTGAEARRHLETAGVVTFDLPAGRLTPGRYECLVASPDGAILYRSGMEITAGD